MRHPELLVAKFGGTSMARPEVVQSQLEYEQNTTDVVVVSAPGKAEGFPTKLTDMLLGHKGDPHYEHFSADQIQDRFASILEATRMSDNPKSLAVVESIPQDITEWLGYFDPKDTSDPRGPQYGKSNAVDALGEYWSAKLFAIQTDREFVDARELIFFDRNGNLDQAATEAAVQSRLTAGGKYVVPGYYGWHTDGRIHKFPRGGSDITGAVIARFLGARQYENWSDVPGFMSTNPKTLELTVEERALGYPQQLARALGRITYLEGRVLAQSGSELLNTEVNPYLLGTGITTVMRETFGSLGNAGTEVGDTRAWQLEPVIGVAGRDDLLMLSMHEFGMNNQSGQTLDLTKALAKANVPYIRGSDGEDDVSLLISKEHVKPLSQIVRQLREKPGRSAELQPAGLAQVVGEGLAGSTRAHTLAHADALRALARNGIDTLGGNDSRLSRSISFFVAPEAVRHSVQVIHQALELGEGPETYLKQTSLW